LARRSQSSQAPYRHGAMEVTRTAVSTFLTFQKAKEAAV